MTMLYIDQDGADIPVEIVEYIGTDQARVQAITGWPFGPDAPTKRRLISRRHQNQVIVHHVL